MAEYKLSYTAEEINEKLGQVGAPISYNDLTDKPSIVTRSEIKSPATQGTYASLYEKPFGDIPTPLREKESMFSLHPQGLNVYQSVETFEIAEIIAGETYKVKWDDTEYTCVAKTQNKIGESVIENVNLGNATKLFGLGFGEDTGEPFFIYFDKGYYDKIYIQTDSTEERHTVAITPVNSIKKIDAKYLPEGIGSSGGNATVKETILSEQLINNFAPDEDFYGLYSASTVFFTPIELGETYTVVWDEKTYSCLTQDVSSLLEEGSIAMGNGSSFGFPGNNEPFIIAVTPFDGAYIYAFLAVDGSMSSSHSVSIYKETTISNGGVSSWNDLTDKPFGGETDILFEGTFQDELIDDNGDGTPERWEGEMLVVDNSNTPLEEGKKYTLTWEGVDYENECFILEGMLPCIGNPAYTGGPDNGCPVIIARDVSGLIFGTPVWFAIILQPSDDITISGTYSCKITLNDIKYLDNKYLDFIETTESIETILVKNQVVENFVESDGAYTSSIPANNFSLEKDQYYKIIWDGEIYEEKGYLFADPAVAIGSIATTPFIIAYIPDENVLMLLSVSDNSSSHTVSISLIEKGKDIIKPDVLPVNIPNDLFVEDEEKEWIEILPAITKEFFLTSIGDSPNFFGTVIESDENTATKWQNHTGKVKVIWDGIPYECEMQTVMGGNAVGNLVAFGGTGNDEPFAAVCLSDNGGNAWILGSLVDTSAQSHTCQIFLLEESKTIVINNDYLNFIEKSNGDEIEIVPEQTITLEQDADLKFKYVAHPGTELYNQLYQVEIGKTYKILWDNAIYTCIAKDASWAVPSDAGEKRKAVTLGNVTLLEDYPLTDSSSNTGEPFVLAIGDYDILSDSISYGMFISPIPNATETLYDIQFSISQILDKVKIKRDYLPEIPTFDLIAMGMPAISLDGTESSLQCDTTEIMAAAAKGIVKLRFAVNIPGFGGMAIENLVPFGYLTVTETYAYAGLMIFDSTPIAISCSVNESGICAFALPLATPIA